MAGAWERFNHRVFVQQSAETPVWKEGELYSLVRAIGGEASKRGNLACFLPHLAAAGLDHVRKRAEQRDAIRRDVWRVQGEVDTPEFIREVLEPYAAREIEVGTATLRSELEDLGKRTNMNGGQLLAVLESLARKAGRVIMHVANRYEIEATRLEYAIRGAHKSVHGELAAAPSARTEGKPRERSEIRSILGTKGMSVHDWAIQAGVDFHTADNYLKGKTRPYQSTRKKLADALGLTELPS